MEGLHNLSAPGMQDALYKTESIRYFLNLELDRFLDQKIILGFLDFRQQHWYPHSAVKRGGETHQEKGLNLRGCRIVNAPFISPSRSIKIHSGKRVDIGESSDRYLTKMGDE